MSVRNLVNNQGIEGIEKRTDAKTNGAQDINDPHQLIALRTLGHETRNGISFDYRCSPNYKTRDYSRPRPDAATLGDDKLYR